MAKAFRETKPCRIIETKYVGPTNTKGGRVIAKTAGNRIIVEWDSVLGIEDNHVAAACALAEKLGWPYPTLGGNLPNGNRGHIVEIVS